MCLCVRGEEGTEGEDDGGAPTIISWENIQNTHLGFFLSLLDINAQKHMLNYWAIVHLQIEISACETEKWRCLQ